MLLNLTTSSSFPTTRKKISNSLQLEPGLTAIVGRNGVGKTTTGIELPRYALFGVKALRGQKADYIDLSVRLEFEVKGLRYVVDRSPKGESLVDADGVVLAVGAEAVNKKIVELFGYGLDVFDIANACLQGKVQQLTDMTPAERKAMIDRLVGLDKLEVIEKSCRDEAKSLGREAEALRSNLGDKPVPPVAPLNYRSSAELEVVIEAAVAVQTERQRVQAILGAVGIPPSSPTAEVSSELWRELADHEERRLDILSQRQALENAMQYIPDAAMTQEEIDHNARWLAYSNEAQLRGARPELSLEDIELSEAQWAAYDSWKPVEPCPKCGFGADQPPRPLEPFDSKAYLQQQRVALARWAEPLEPVEEPKRWVNALQLASYQRALDQQPRLRELEEKHAALVVPKNRSQELKDIETLNRQWQVYLQLKEAYDRRKAEADALRLPEDNSEELTALRDELALVRQYEKELDRFYFEIETYNDTIDEIERREERAAGFAAGAKTLKELRLEFKTHLAPAVASVASQLVTAMTAGELSKIDVTGDFEVFVDGQPIRTLSGSEAAVANLALRIGLGQVLTNKVFPVFLGDEIDASMDAERAGYTAEAIRGLSTVLKQIILVTHKEIEADQMIVL